MMAVMTSPLTATTATWLQNQMQQPSAPEAGPLDRFTHNSEGPKLLSFKDILAATATKSADAGVKVPAYLTTEASMQKMSNAKRLSTLEQMRHDEPKQYAALLDAVREGKIKSDDVKLAVGVDHLEATKWAKGAGKDTFKHIKAEYEAGHVKMGAVKGDEPALTEPGADNGKGGRSSTITFSPATGSNPDVLAATLAHEGQHSKRYADGTTKKMLREETDAHMTQSAVWGELKKSDKSDLSGQAADMDKTASFAGDSNKMMGHIAGEYASGYINHYKQSDKSSDLQSALDVVNQFQQENKDSNGALLKATDDTAVFEIYSSITELSKHTKHPEAAVKEYEEIRQEVLRR